MEKEINNYSQYIKDLRNELLLTQVELADELEVSSLTISRWELGKSKPSFKARRRIKELLKENKL